MIHVPTPVMLLLALLLTLVACDVQAGADSAVSNAEEVLERLELEDPPLTAMGADLLDLAYRSASEFPLNPHVKNRSRAQELVVQACLELGQTGRALAYAGGIENWRRGLAYADIAFHLAREGSSDAVRQLLEGAELVAATPSDAASQDWHRDRIRSRIAQTLARLGEWDEATRIDAALDGAEAGKVAALEARTLEASAFEDRIASLDAVVRAGGFDHVQNALDACAQLYERFYDDEQRRSRCERTIRSSWAKVPLQVRIEVAMRLARTALAHGDDARAAALLGEAREVLEGATWLPEDSIPMAARLAGLRYLAGEQAAARADADAALLAYESDRERIVDIQRADVLRPLAETYATMGERHVVVALYARAIEEGTLNANARPRTDDLVATACSMALHGFDPDTELWKRMREIHAALGDPW